MLLTVFALVSAMMVLTRAAALPEEMPGNDQTVSLVRRWTCYGGWSLFGGRCFRFVTRPMTWARAAKNCMSMGGNLASVHNIQEYRNIQRLISSISHKYEQTWIGGTDAHEENEWFWIDGSPFTYQHWCAGEPNNSRGQHCLQMNHGDQKCWDDYQCSALRPSVCVKKM